MKLNLHRFLMCAASVALAIGLLVLALGIVQGAGSLTRITTASHSNRDSVVPSLNAGGTKIAFMSDSDFLGQGIPNDQDEIWLYDTTVMTLTRITTSSPSLRRSRIPNLSADGTKIAFDSEADFLGQGILTNQFEIWLYSQNPGGGGHETYLPILLKQSPY
jgi:Tol biopolymer transport system component